MNIKYNGKVGTQPKFDFTFPEGFVLIVDTREQAALFKKPPKGLLVLRDTVPCGDYTVRGFETEIVIERKSIPDLYNSLFSDWERELKKLCRISEYKRKWLVVEGSEDETLCWQLHSGVHPNSMRARLCAIQIRLGIPIHYAATRHSAERFILDLLLRFYRDKRENKEGFSK
jgi:ERCC4-type nuclease